MVRSLAIAVLLAATAAGCAFDNKAAERPARFQMAVNSRRMPSSTRDPGSNVAPRTTTPPGGVEALPATSPVTGSAQFTMQWLHHTYLGAEAEAGTLGLEGSSFAGAYGIVGWGSSSPLGSLAAELAVGPRSIRYAVDTENLTSTAFEPRLRGEFWLSSQITFGATVGASLDDRSFMAGMYLSVYSHDFNVWRRRR